MPYAFTQDVPADAAMYAEIKAMLPEQPDGLIVHLAVERDAGLRYIDVWENEEAWENFRDAHVEDAVSQVLARHGIPHDHSQVSSETLRVVDAWIG